jgi:acetylornithine deacetylase/succinyl-diaminopimelate desuccinylase-like protein
MINEDRLVKTLQDLVRIPSHENCSGMSKYVTAEIMKIGMEPEVDGDGNIIARIGSGPAFLLNAHMDTVGVKGYDDAFSGEVRDGKLYGRGSTDDKSGVAAMLELMKALKDKPAKKQVVFAFTVGEEGGNEETDGAYKVVKKVNATHGIVLESSVNEQNNGLDIGLGCKGRFIYEIDVLGKPGHSSSPHLAKNSIYLALKLIEKLKEFETSSMNVVGDKTESSTAAVTQIEAKEGGNIIPGKCTITFDYRALPHEKEPGIRSRIEAVCRETLGDSFKLRSAHSKESYLDMDDRFIKMSMDAAKEAGFTPFVSFSSGWIDGQVFSKSGIKTFKIGPGTEHQAHKTPEYCWVPGMVKATETVLGIIRKWDGS